MNTVFTAYTARSHQFQIRFIGQRGRLERIAGLAARKMLPGHAAQFRVNGRDQLAERFFIAITPGSEQRADVPWSLSGHASAILPKKIRPWLYFLSSVPGIKAGGI